MTPILRQVRGCDICMIPKDVHIDLNIFRTKIVSYLQNKSIGRHTRNSVFSTLITENYKKKVFPDSEFYMLISNMHLSAYHVLLLNQIILFIWMVILVFLMIY